ncbi:hypothetical protein ACQPZ2_00830 [Nocardia pseudovaccinii]|uniref:hypothetical protein n=1 Tax=Nocardia pseudovaccinii TaxID=189540 RepID=UPI003D943681
MLFVRESVLGMASTIEQAVDATQGHATRIAGAGFEATHAGQDYLEQGNKLAAGVEGIVTMLQSWSESSGATVAALRQAVTTTVATDQGHGAQIAAAEVELGSA